MCTMFSDGRPSQDDVQDGEQSQSQERRERLMKVVLSLNKSELVMVVQGLLQVDQAEVVQQAASTLLLATHEQSIKNHAAEEPLADCISVFTF